MNVGQTKANRSSYVHGTSLTALSGSTIGASLRRTVEVDPDHEALVSVHQGVRLTYGQLWDKVEETALALLALGVERDDRVGIWSPTCAEWTFIQYATARIGAVLVNVNPAYRDHELAYALKQSGVSTLVAATSFRTSDYVAMIAAVRSHCPALRRVVTIGEQRAGEPGDLTWAELIGSASGATTAQLAEREAGLGFDDPINIQYTSGTTGNPKGATLTHHNILNNGLMVGGMLDYSAADRVCIPVPLYHCFGMVMGNLACTAVGATMVYPAEAFDPLACLQAVDVERCTSIYGVPTMYIAQLEHPRFAEFDMSSLRTGIMAGAPCPVELMKRVTSDMHIGEITSAYGMTETSPVSFMTRRDDDFDRRVSTVGTMLPHVEGRIVDPDSGATMERGQAGEVCVRGYVVMRGYWEDLGATAAAIDPGGWMHTGDLGVIDDDGYLNIVGRIKDMVIRGGENIYPREIEELLYTHPGVADVQVFGVPDERLGEVLVAWVVRREGADLDADSVREFCGARVARYKIPKHVKFVEDFPMTVTGKAQKFRMREVAIAELGLTAADAIHTA